MRYGAAPAAAGSAHNTVAMAAMNGRQRH